MKEHYTIAEAAHLAGLSRQRVRRLLHEMRGARAEPVNFSEVVAMRNAAELWAGGVSSYAIYRAFRALRGAVGPGGYISARRFLASPGGILAREAGACWRVDDGQYVLPLDAGATSQAVQLRKDVPCVDREDLGSEALLRAARTSEPTHPQRAAELYNRCLERDPVCVEAWVNLGRLYHEREDGARALHCFERAVAVAERHPVAQFNLGVAYHGLERFEEAARAYRMALACDPLFGDAHFNLAAVLERQGERRAALRHLLAYQRLCRASEGKSSLP